MVSQFQITLPNYRRGYHLITGTIVQSLPELPESGLLHLMIQHTSAALSINENADPAVRNDFEYVFDKLIPERDPNYTHDTEGADDMPAHIKASMIGPSVTIPITNHKLNLGTWQGIYLCEFRNYGGRRNIFGTILS